jgi:hypothetical protein
MQYLYYIGLLAFLFLFAACSEEKINPPEDYFAEFCVTFTDNKDEYQLHLEKNVHLIPDPHWVYPQKVKCNFPGYCKSEWISSASIDFPHEGELVQRPWLGDKFCLSCPHTREALVSPIDSFLSLNPLQFEKLEIKFLNARDSLPQYYGRLLEGKWTVKQRYDDSISYNQLLYAKIVGECKNLPKVADYCLSAGDRVLSRKNTLLPYRLNRFFSEDSRLCYDSYRVNKILYFKMENSEKEIFSLVESGTASRKYEIKSAILLPEPTFLDVDSVDYVFYLTHDRIDAKWMVELECDSSRFSKEIPFTLGLLGECNFERPLLLKELDMQDSKYKRYWQGIPR